MAVAVAVAVAVAAGVFVSVTEVVPEAAAAAAAARLCLRRVSRVANRSFMSGVRMSRMLSHTCKHHREK